jgi:hypothetical protein
MELQIVRALEDVADLAAFHFIDEFAAFDQSRPEDRVLQIGCRLAERGDGVALSHRAVAEPAQLRKHVPHPMTAFTAVAQLTADPFENGVLRPHETIGIE